MMAAALIPLMFILGLLALFMFGVWPVGALTGIAISVLLVGLGVGLTQLLAHLDTPKAKRASRRIHLGA
jgi:hypothetical protein